MVHTAWRIPKVGGDWGHECTHLAQRREVDRIHLALGLHHVEEWPEVARRVSDAIHLCVIGDSAAWPK